MKNKILFILLMISFIGHTQNWGEQEILHPNPGTENNFPNGINAPAITQSYTGDTFGFTVEISGDYAAISAPNKHKQLGVVHIYKKDANDNYVGTQILRSSDIAPGDYLGQNISSNGEYLFVGNSLQDTDVNGNNFKSAAGAVYIFKIDGNGDWQEVQKIVPLHRDGGDKFGKTLDSDGDYLIVGSEDNTNINDQNPSSGDNSVIIFKKDANGIWNQTQKLKASDPDHGSNFGTRGVTISGDYIAVGSHYELLENGTRYYGAVYIFKVDANGIWNETQLLKNTTSSSLLGTSVAMDGDLLIASDPGYTIKDANGSITHYNAGAATLFVKNDVDSWVFVDQFTMSNPEANLTATGGALPNGGGSDYGFNQVGISGNTFLFGVPKKDRIINGVTKNNVGAAYFSGDIEALGLLSAPLSIEKNKFLTSIKGYPNPIQNNFHINLNKTYKNIKVTVTNLLGKTVFKNNYQQKSSINLQLQNLSKGVYLVKLNTDNTNSKVMKVIKQ